MANSEYIEKYDEVLTSILVNEKSIIGFLSSIFNFLARRTDFYYIPEGPYENMGFPPGVAEELVVKVLRSCDPKNWKGPNGAKKPTDMNNEIMCSTVAQEVEIVAENEDDYEEDIPTLARETETLQTNEAKVSQPQYSSSSTEKVPICSTGQPKPSTEAPKLDTGKPKPSTEKDSNMAPPIIPTQRNSETYNGAERDNYSWSQTIMELDVTIRLPPDIKSSRDLKVTINASDLCVACRNGVTIIKDQLPFKIKASDSFWSISEGKLLIHLEKVQERWWNRLLDAEEPIDVSKIDCSRSLYELPDDHIAKVREMQWNQEQKLKGLPTSDELRNIEILKKAWNADGSPFKGQEFDPSVLRPQ